MIGLSKNGKLIADIDHVKQSIIDILTTARGSRVMLREYGSDLYKYRDNPINPTTIAKIYKATAEAIDEWEPRVSLNDGKLKVMSDDTGKLTIDVEFKYKLNGKKYSLDGVNI